MVIICCLQNNFYMLQYKSYIFLKGGGLMSLSKALHFLKMNIKTIIFYFVIILLVAFLAFSVFTINNKNKTIKQNETKIAEITNQLNDTKSELEQAKKDKEDLQKENSGLKTEIEKLKAQKAAEEAITLQPSPQPAYPPATKVCYLTFDDGPSNNTIAILDTLEKYGAKATFFVAGSNSKLEYVKQIHEKGHVIGLHTNTHNYAQIYSSTTAYFDDLNAISARVEALIGVKSKIIRFPGGSSNSVSKKHCAGIMTVLTKQVVEQGYAYFDWNVSSGDAVSKPASPEQITANVLNGAKNKNSICVLMHDSTAKTTTAEALPAIIEGLKQMGYSFEGLKVDSFGYHQPVAN